MLTERGINDAAMCPRLLLEPSQRSTRITEDRRDYTLQDLRTVLDTKTSSKYTTIDEDFLGGYVLDRVNGGRFWFVVDTEAGKFLLSVNQITVDDTGTVLVYRTKYFGSEQQKRAEEMCRVLLYRHLQEAIPDPVIVISQYPDDTQYSTEDLHEGEYGQFDRLAERFADLADDPLSSPANSEHCPKCKWETCPYRVPPEPVTPGIRPIWET